MKYAWIAANRRHWPVSALCEQLGGSVSGYHQYVLRIGAKDGRRRGSGGLSNDALLAHIKAIQTQVKGEHGCPRIWKELSAHDARVLKERATRSCQRGLSTKASNAAVIF